MFSMMLKSRLEGGPASDVIMAQSSLAHDGFAGLSVALRQFAVFPSTDKMGSLPISLSVLQTKDPPQTR